MSFFRRTCPKCGRKRGQSHAIDCQMRKVQGSTVGGSADKELNEFRQKVRDSYREWYGKEMP